MTLQEKIPVWLIAVLSLATAILVAYAVFDGRRVELWPPVIHEKRAEGQGSSSELAGLQGELQNIKGYLSPEEVIALFPPETQKKTVNLTRLAAEKAYKDSGERLERLTVQNEALQASNKELLSRPTLEEARKIDGTFLYKLLLFNHDAQCYGTTLNFTSGGNRPQCRTKEELASRFLDFLAEIDFYANDRENSKATAKEELLKLQIKHEFNTKGWYGPDVFRAIIREFHGKA